MEGRKEVEDRRLQGRKKGRKEAKEGRESMVGGSKEATKKGS